MTRQQAFPLADTVRCTRYRDVLDPDILLRVAAVLALALTAYSAAHYFCILVFAVGRPAARKFLALPEAHVAVLIPARQEGERALRAVHSALEQDHPGRLDVHLLLRDASDSSLPYLRQAFDAAPLDGSSDPATAVFVPESEHARRLFVHFIGEDSKSRKINAAVAKLEATYVAILDADHRAEPEWIRSTLALMYESGARAMQSRRRPQSAIGFFGLWDSLHQHIGVEVLNIAFSRLGLSVFITGTTVVLETELLRREPLSDCITEDVYLSYRLLAGAERVGANPHFGSSEEVSPDLFSFLARRRRWANGHSQAFLDNLNVMWAPGLRFAERLQFLLHGGHYLLALPVFVLHCAIGLLLALDTSAGPLLLAGLTAVVLGGLTVRGQAGTIPGFIVDVLTAAAWFFPAVLILLRLGLAILLQDSAVAMLPASSTLQLLGLVGLGAPLLLQLAGLAGMRQLGIGTAVAVTLSYPVAFYLDLCGALLGLGDFLLGRKTWRPVARRHGGRADASEPRDLRASWTLVALFRACRRVLSLRDGFVADRTRWVVVLVLALLLTGALILSRAERIPLRQASCQVLKHDTDPWIVPAARMGDYCTVKPVQRRRWGRRRGGFSVTREDHLAGLDASYWEKLQSTFDCNRARFRPANVGLLSGGGVSFRVSRDGDSQKPFTAGSIAGRSRDVLYGRFEAVLKPARGSGLITAFFLYRFDPWQEIDIEFLGRDTTKILLNVFYNPGNKGDLYNYGLRGTPVLIDLGFDAAAAFHHYAIEWDRHEIRWLVDGKLIHRRRSGRPTPIPHLPMRLYLNAWPSCSKELAGPLPGPGFSAQAQVRSVVVSRWRRPLWSQLLSALDGLARPSSVHQDWRARSEWMQPRHARSR